MSRFIEGKASDDLKARYAALLGSMTGEQATQMADILYTTGTKPRVVLETLTVLIEGAYEMLVHDGFNEEGFVLVAVYERIYTLISSWVDVADEATAMMKRFEEQGEEEHD